MVNGHLALVDAPWALTAIAQKQFWPLTDLAGFGDGRVRDVLSVVVSNWDVPGTFVPKPARLCSREEIRAEVWAQLKAHVNGCSRVKLRDAAVVDWYLADSIEHRADGTVVERPAAPTRQAISPKTAARLLPMMASVFDGLGTKTAGTGASVWVPGWKCGGKTGTAHKYDPAIRDYARDRYLSSFAGLAPVAGPRLAIVVLIDDPAGGDYYGGKIAGPVFATIASESLRYLGVPGDAPLERPPLPSKNP